MFLKTFAEVREHFRHIFLTLFGGGECDLRLENPELPLDCDIEIHASPRGKRTQRIHLLSSGERALVALSLLFGIFLTKPSPFCLLDEVDAPLDDQNVGRFVKMLNQFKVHTQFIVITHNPRTTTEAADAVYGVTMQEPGVSSLVSVRMKGQPVDEDARGARVGLVTRGPCLASPARRAARRGAPCGAPARLRGAAAAPRVASRSERRPRPSGRSPCSARPTIRCATAFPRSPSSAVGSRPPTCRCASRCRWATNIGFATGVAHRHHGHGVRHAGVPSRRATCCPSGPASSGAAS